MPNGGINPVTRKIKKTAPPAIVVQEHGRYLIKAGSLQNVIVARAFPKPPSKFRHLVAEARGATTQEAIDTLIGKLDQLHSERRSLRRADPGLPCGVPTIEEYADALRSLSTGPKLLGMLHDHARYGSRGTPLSDFARAADIPSVPELIAAYERVGRDILTIIEPDELHLSGLAVVLPDPESDGRPATGARSLQPELQAALLSLLGSERRSG